MRVVRVELVTKDYKSHISFHTFVDYASADRARGMIARNCGRLMKFEVLHHYEVVVLTQEASDAYVASEL